MRTCITFIILLFSISTYALSQVNDTETSLIDALPGICPQKITCALGTNFLKISAAEHCGICRCHGGVAGCAGGAKGRIICGDGTTDSRFGCQYQMKP